jgi:hypothetical protein
MLIGTQHTNSIVAGLTPMLSPDSPQTLSAAAGDLLHKTDVYCCFNSVSNPEALKLLTNPHQSEWLKQHFPSLVPPPAGDGTPPSDHRVATAFEVNYLTIGPLRRTYLNWLYNGQPSW